MEADGGSRLVTLLVVALCLAMLARAVSWLKGRRRQQDVQFEDVAPQIRVTLDRVKDESRPAPRPRTAREPANPAMPPIGSIDGLAYKIEYEDAEGEVTERVIRLPSAAAGAGFYIDAYCYRAEARRTFRSDRILSMTDHNTGEVIEDPESYFQRLANPDAEHAAAHRNVLPRAKPGLLALLWIAKADGAPGDADIAIMVDFAEARLRITQSTMGWDRGYVGRWIVDLQPIYDSALGAVSRMPPNGREAALFRDYAERLATTSARKKRRARLLRILP